MIKRSFKILFVSTLILSLLVGTVFHQREPLIMLGANQLLARHQFSVTALQGLQVNGSRVALTELEVALHAHGLRLLIAELQLAYSLSGNFRVPTLEVLEIGSARLLRDPVFFSDKGALEESALRTGDILQMLRNLPQGTLVIHELALPDQEGRIDIKMQSKGNEVVAHITSNTLLLTVSIAQTTAESPALLQAKIESVTSTPLKLEFTLTPTAFGHRLDANGLIDIPDVQAFNETHLENALNLPVQSLTLDWDITAFIAETLPTVMPLPLNLGINPGSVVSMPAQLREGLGAISLDVSERAEFTISAHAPATGQSDADAPDGYTIALVDGSRLNGKLEQSEVGDYQVSTEFLLEQLKFDMGAALGGAFHIETRHLELLGPQPWLPQLDLAADLVFTADHLTYNGRILLQDAPSTPGLVSQGRYEFASGVGRFSLDLPTTQFMGGEGRSLAAHLRGWPYSFDLLTGSLAMQLELDWQAAPEAQTLSDAPTAPGILSGSIVMELVDAAGYYGEFFFRGLNLPLTGTVDSAARLPLSTPPLRLTATALDVGLTIENFVMDFQIDGSKQLLSMPAIQAEALGGSLYGQALVYDFDSDRNQLTLMFSGLRLENMLALTQYDGVAATGAVTGELPITISATGIEVEAGTLRADHPGGSIMYLDAVLTGGNAGINLVNQALSNYQFESLESAVDYQPDGELLLSMKLQGHNPNMQGGQRINLNLNLSNNIPELLESLQARRAIEDFLEGKYQK